MQRATNVVQQRISAVSKQLGRTISTMSHPGLVLYTAATPNGYKVSIALEELKALGKIGEYELKVISFKDNEQKSDWFLKVNPNGRIPALTDRTRKVDVWESASIVLYLGQHYDPDRVLSFSDPDEYTDMLNWIFFIQGGLGPMQGQANHFNRYALEKIPYAQKRYTDEVHRLYQTYNTHLENRDYLAGKGRGKYSFADICTVTWVRSHVWAGIENLNQYPHLNRWCQEIGKREAYKVGLTKPQTEHSPDILKDKDAAEKKAAEAREWILKSQQSESEKK